MTQVPAMLSAVGNICTQWAYLELLLARCIWYFLNLDKDVGIVITGKFDLPMRIQIAIEIGEAVDLDKNLVKTSKSVKLKFESKKIRERRNTAVHGIYASSPNDNIITVEMHRGKSAGIAKTTDARSLMEIGNDIREIGQELIAAMAKLSIDID
jgi:hypothetical protein